MSVKSKRNLWTEPSFDFESASVLDPDGESYGQIRVTLSLYAVEGQSVPLLMMDAEPLFELLVGPDVVARVVPESEFSHSDRQKINALIGRTVRELAETHRDSIERVLSEGRG